MKVLGGIAILIAAVMGWGAFNNFSNASTMKSEMSKESGVTKFVGEATGLSNIDRSRIQSIEDNGTKCAVGAGILGLVGLIMCGSGGKKES